MGTSQHMPGESPPCNDIDRYNAQLHMELIWHDVRMVLAKQQVAFVMQNHPAVRETPLEHWSLGAEKKVVGLEKSVRG